jgi:hypothetical protein
VVSAGTGIAIILAGWGARPAGLED